MPDLWLAIYQAFAFPVGTAMGVALVAILYVVETEWGKRRWVKALRSTNMACWTIGLIAVACVIGDCFLPTRHSKHPFPLWYCL